MKVKLLRDGCEKVHRFDVCWYSLSILLIYILYSRTSNKCDVGASSTHLWIFNGAHYKHLVSKCVPYGSSFAEYSHHQNQLTHWLLLSDPPGERPFMEKLKETSSKLFYDLNFHHHDLQGDHYCSFWWKASPNAGAELIAPKNCIILNYDNRPISSMQLQGAIISIYIFACPLQVTKMSKGKERLDYNHNEHENFKKSFNESQVQWCLDVVE